MQTTRRNFLRATGALLALPFLESSPALRALAATAGPAAVKPPVRMGIFSVTGGTVLESWKPAAAGALDKLPSILRPLEFAKQDMTVISGLCHNGRGENVNGHEHCAFTHLTGAEYVRKENGRIQASPSVDQVAAAASGDQTVLPSLEIGLNGNQTYSFRGAEQPLPYEGNPRLIYERMFRGRKPVVPNWSRRASAGTVAAANAPSDSSDRSVIDMVLGQAKDLRGKLGRNDQGRLDEYLESVRSVEKRMAFVESRHQQEILDLASPGPSKLVELAELPAPGKNIWEITQPIERDPDRYADYMRLMADLMILAFQTDTTRVCTFAAGSDETMFHGVVTVGFERHCHTLEHQGNSFRPEDADPIAREACRQIHAWYTSVFAEMIQKMKSIDEGGSTLLDNTMMLYTSYMADGGHGKQDYPAVLVGRGGGTIKTGQHLAFEKKAPMANLYIEMLDRMGAKCDKFGDSHSSEFAGNYNGRLPGLS